MDKHPWLGAKVTYRKSTGTIISVKQGDPLLDLETGKITGDTIKFKFKPDSGARAYWTCSFVNSPVQGKVLL